jgi:hypothetical protein
MMTMTKAWAIVYRKGHMFAPKEDFVVAVKWTREEARQVRRETYPTAVVIRLLLLETR